MMKQVKGLKSSSGKAVKKAKPAKAERETELKNNIFLAMLRGLIYSLILSVAGILIFALVLKLSPQMDETIIGPVNQIIKILSVLIGAWFSVGSYGGKGWMVGGLTGVAYMLVGFIVYALIEGTLGSFGTMLSDLALGAACGAIGGIITVNLKKK